MEQKIIKIGNSFGILIPRYIIKELNLELNRRLYLDLYIDEKTLVLRVNKNRAKGITPKFIRVLNDFNKTHGPALAKLAEL